MNKVKNLSDSQDFYHTVIIGGGIVGAGIFRDLSLHNSDTLLIEKGDFSSQTSSKSSKMLHGGIRYLENFDFKLVFEALHEKNLWLKLAPHLCYEQGFFLPIHKNSKRPLWMIKIGLFLYDLLSQFKNRPHKMFSKDEIIQKFPQINPEGLSGGGLYYDGVMDDFKITFDVIFDAITKYSHALNYTELLNFERDQETKKITLSLKDTINNQIKKVECNELVFATGPFTDKLMNQLNIKWSNRLLPSKGAHIWISKKDLDIDSAIVMNPNDGRVIFVIPRNNKILVGTTEKMIGGDLFDLNVDPDEIDYLIQNLNEYFPKASITKDSILSSFAGVRPLVKELESNDPGKTAREHKIMMPFDNVHVIIGGKYTTFRCMGQEISRKICLRQDIPYNSSKTKQKLEFESIPRAFSTDEVNQQELDYIAMNYHVKKFDDLKRRCPYTNGPELKKVFEKFN